MQSTQKQSIEWPPSFSMCQKRRGSSSSSWCGGRTGVVCLIVCVLWIILLLITLVFHLNHQQNRTLDSTESTSTVLSVKPRDDFTKKQCTFQAGEIAIQIPQLNFPLVTVGKFAKDSKRFQASMLKITKKLVDSFRVANASAEQIDSLSTQVDDQLTRVYLSLDLYSNSNRLFELVEQPLRNVTESTKRIAHHYLSTARKFEQLFHLMKVVVNGSLGKKLMNLENAINVVEGHLHSSAHSQRQLEKAIQSVTNSSIESALRLERDNAELESASHEWQSLKMRSDSVNCFESWEWNWWPITYTSTSVCFGRPSDQEWANSNARLEHAKWKSNCSTIELNNLTEQIQKWNEVDNELSIAIEKLVENQDNLNRKLALFNGTSSDSLVRMERETCKMTTGLTRVYNEAAEFFLDISSRISDNLAILEPTVLDNVSISRPMPSDAFHELRSNLKKTISEALDHDAVHAIIPKLISRQNHMFRVQMKKLKQMKAQNTISSDTLVNLLEHIRKSYLKLKSADQNWQKCDALSIQ